MPYTPVTTDRRAELVALAAAFIAAGCPSPEQAVKQAERTLALIDQADPAC